MRPTNLLTEICGGSETNRCTEVFASRRGIFSHSQKETLNEWDIKLGHKRYFDRDTFRSIFEKSGLIITKEEGLMLKPFATSQISSLNLSETVWNVLVHSGDLSPRYAYCLYVEICIPEK